MPRSSKKVAHAKALRTEGSNQFTEDIPHETSASEDIDSKWEEDVNGEGDDDDDDDDDEWREAHQSMRKLYACRLVRHCRSRTSVHDQRVSNLSQDQIRAHYLTGYNRAKNKRL